MAITEAFPGPSAVVDSLELRKNLAGLIVRDTAGNPRAGVFPRHTNALVTSTATMSVNVAAFEAALVRTGPLFVQNDGTVAVAIATAPVSNSRIDVVWVRQQENGYNGFADGSNTPLISVTAGTAAASPVKPAIPAGALELATVLVPAGATATNSGGVVITQTAQYTAAAGGVVLLRDNAESNAWTPAPGSRAYRLDAKCGVQYVDGVVPNWYHSGGRPFGIPITFGGGYSSSGTSPARLHDQNGRFYFEGVVVTASATFTAGANTPIGTIPATYAPDTQQEFAVVANGIFSTLRVTAAGALSFIPSTTFTASLSLTLAGVNWRNKNL